MLDKFRNNGFIEFKNIFDDALIEKWNSKLDFFYKNKKDKIILDFTDNRVDKIGFEILQEFFNDKIKYIISKLIPDPIILWAGSNEIPGNTKISHVNHNDIGGWHTDIGEDLSFIDLKNPHYMTFFVYLTDVGPEDGPFEITNVTKKREINSSTSAKTLLGKKGTCFVWGNGFFHRAAPNYGNLRRRILKIQLQNNYLENSYIDKMKFFDNFLTNNDNYLNFLIGKKHSDSRRNWKIDCKIIEQNIEFAETYNKTSTKISLIKNIKIKIKNLLNAN
tara:strand:+ start:154 stop:981 length:828 start_codon:yes stop_codon:yes gene_type:complete